jgi:hypothetical protein
MPQEPATRLIRCEVTRQRERAAAGAAPIFVAACDTDGVELKSSVGRLADRLLTGWSLVRIRPGEPNKNKHLSELD